MDEQNKISLTPIWSIPTLCLGLGLIALCVLIPAAQANKLLSADKDKLQRDLTYTQSQLDANQEFLSIASTDPEVAERLAQRQMRQIRQGTSVLELKGIQKNKDASPFQMICVPIPAPSNEYQPLKGPLAQICGTTQRQLYSIAVGMFMIATSLVFGASSQDSRE